MAIWKDWYKGNVADFHFYNETVNGTQVQKERLTMNMPKKVCEDITKLLWTEKTRIDLSNQRATKRYRQKRRFRSSPTRSSAIRMHLNLRIFDSAARTTMKMDMSRAVSSTVPTTKKAIFSAKHTMQNL